MNGGRKGWWKDDQRTLNAIKGSSTDEINNLKVGNEGVGISHLTWLEYIVFFAVSRSLDFPCKGKFRAENAYSVVGNFISTIQSRTFRYILYHHQRYKTNA